MRKLLLLLLIPGAQVYSQAIHYLPYAPYTGMGAYSDHFTDVFSAVANQAALANVKQAAAGVFAEQKFMLALTQATGVAALPTKHGNLGLVFNYAGTDGYSESQVGLALAKKLGKIDLGVRFNYTHIQIQGYGNDATVSIELGTLWHITDQWHTGVQLINPVGGRFRKQEAEKLAAVYKFGLGYEVSEKVLLSTEIIKEEQRPVNVQAGIQYQFMDKLFARGGIATATTTPFLGLGWQWKNMRADITASYHPQLGFTPGLMLIFGEKLE